MILGAEAVERRIGALETLDVTFLGVDEAGNGFENLEGGLSIDGAEVGLSLIGKGDALSP